ncbi:hypothetical protein R3P38DRAFT_2789004 [Favolaschia claudopus]|uniref:Uncharacterized protein n=1 Tax=Favolaschia claudopus TaxID=2862362 RepID=A0AAW0AIZ1_9AGAR
MAYSSIDDRHRFNQDLESLAVVFLHIPLSRGHLAIILFYSGSFASAHNRIFNAIRLDSFWQNAHHHQDDQRRGWRDILAALNVNQTNEYRQREAWNQSGQSVLKALPLLLPSVPPYLTASPLPPPRIPPPLTSPLHRDQQSSLPADATNVARRARPPPVLRLRRSPTPRGRLLISKIPPVPPPFARALKRPSSAGSSHKFASKKIRLHRVSSPSSVSGPRHFVSPSREPAKENSMDLSFGKRIRERGPVYTPSPSPSPSRPSSPSHLSTPRFHRAKAAVREESLGSVTSLLPLQIADSHPAVRPSTPKRAHPAASPRSPPPLHGRRISPAQLVNSTPPLLPLPIPTSHPIVTPTRPFLLPRKPHKSSSCKPRRHGTSNISIKLKPTVPVTRGSHLSDSEEDERRVAAELLSCSSSDIIVFFPPTPANQTNTWIPVVQENCPANSYEDPAPSSDHRYSVPRTPAVETLASAHATPLRLPSAPSPTSSVLGDVSDVENDDSDATSEDEEKKIWRDHVRKGKRRSYGVSQEREGAGNDEERIVDDITFRERRLAADNNLASAALAARLAQDDAKTMHYDIAKDEFLASLLQSGVDFDTAHKLLGEAEYCAPRGDGDDSQDSDHSSVSYVFASEDDEEIVGPEVPLLMRQLLNGGLSLEDARLQLGLDADSNTPRGREEARIARRAERRRLKLDRLVEEEREHERLMELKKQLCLQRAPAPGPSEPSHPPEPIPGAAVEEEAPVVLDEEEERVFFIDARTGYRRQRFLNAAPNVSLRRIRSAISRYMVRDDFEFLVPELFGDVCGFLRDILDEDRIPAARYHAEVRARLQARDQQAIDDAALDQRSPPRVAARARRITRERYAEAAAEAAAEAMLRHNRVEMEREQADRIVSDRERENRRRRAEAAAIAAESGVPPNDLSVSGPEAHLDGGGGIVDEEMPDASDGVEGHSDGDGVIVDDEMPDVSDGAEVDEEMSDLTNLEGESGNTSDVQVERRRSARLKGKATRCYTESSAKGDISDDQGSSDADSSDFEGLKQVTLKTKYDPQQYLLVIGFLRETYSPNPAAHRIYQKAEKWWCKACYSAWNRFRLKIKSSFMRQGREDHALRRTQKDSYVLWRKSGMSQPFITPTVADPRHISLLAARAPKRRKVRPCVAGVKCDSEYGGLLWVPDGTKKRGYCHRHQLRWVRMWGREKDQGPPGETEIQRELRRLRRLEEFLLDPVDPYNERQARQRNNDRLDDDLHRKCHLPDCAGTGTREVVCPCDQLPHDFCSSHAERFYNHQRNSAVGAHFVARRNTYEGYSEFAMRDCPRQVLIIFCFVVHLVSRFATCLCCKRRFTGTGGSHIRSLILIEHLHRSLEGLPVRVRGLYCYRCNGKLELLDLFVSESRTFEIGAQALEDYVCARGNSSFTEAKDVLENYMETHPRLNSFPALWSKYEHNLYIKRVTPLLPPDMGKRPMDHVADHDHVFPYRFRWTSFNRNKASGRFEQAARVEAWEACYGLEVNTPEFRRRFEETYTEALRTGVAQAIAAYDEPNIRALFEAAERDPEVRRLIDILQEHMRLPPWSEPVFHPLLTQLKLRIEQSEIMREARDGLMFPYALDVEDMTADQVHAIVLATFENYIQFPNSEDGTHRYGCPVPECELHKHRDPEEDDTDTSDERETGKAKRAGKTTRK